MTLRNAFDKVASESTLSLLKSIRTLLKPLGIITGGGSNRLSVDINNVSSSVNVAQATAANLNATVSLAASQTLTTVGTVNNQAQMGGVAAFDLAKAMSRAAYNTGIRAKLS